MLRALLLSGLLLMVWPREAEAALTLCNRTSYVLYAATSVIQSPKSETSGWTRIVPGDCQMARKEPLKSDATLLHARSSLAHSGPARAWGGNYPVCVKDANFTIRQAVTQPYCTADDTFALPFVPIDNRGKPAWTTTLDEQPVLPSLGAAQLAGVKRLLQDNGYKIARLDARPDKQTGVALADFRKRMKFSPDAGNAELFQALENEAMKRNAPAGYTVCNDTKEILLVALGQMDKGKSVSRGWWTVQGGACAKAITTPLNEDAVYLLAQKKNGAILAGGTQKFCTTVAAFEIQGAAGCAGRGYAEQGFARTQTRGKPGTIVRITATGMTTR